MHIFMFEVPRLSAYSVWELSDLWRLQMIKSLESAFLTTTELLDRGWTKTLIKRFLPNPDGSIAVKHWANFRGQDTYAAVKIWNVEQSADFGLAFLKSWKGRMKGMIPEEVLAELRKQPHPEIPQRDRSEVLLQTQLAEAEGHLQEARMRGLRTPHKA